MKFIRDIINEKKQGSAADNARNTGSESGSTPRDTAQPRKSATASDDASNSDPQAFVLEGKHCVNPNGEPHHVPDVSLAQARDDLRSFLSKDGDMAKILLAEAEGDKSEQSADPEVEPQAASKPDVTEPTVSEPVKNPISQAKAEARAKRRQMRAMEKATNDKLNSERAKRPERPSAPIEQSERPAAPAPQAAQPPVVQHEAAEHEKPRDRVQTRPHPDFEKTPRPMTRAAPPVQTQPIAQPQPVAAEPSQPAVQPQPQPQPVAAEPSQPAMQPQPQPVATEPSRPAVQTQPVIETPVPPVAQVQSTVPETDVQPDSLPLRAVQADETMPQSEPEQPVDLSSVSVPTPAAGRGSRRAGRVKTRLLGFSPAQNSVIDPFDKEAEAEAASQTKFPVGWLVVIGGEGLGTSFTLFNGVAQIGRGEGQAIRLDFGDNSISRANHAAIAYDLEQKAFYLGHGGKANLVRRNGKPVLSTEQMISGDTIRIGETSLRFVGLCGDEFNWENTENVGLDHASFG